MIVIKRAATSITRNRESIIRKICVRKYSETMNFTLAAANKVFYDSANIRQVDVPSFSGSFGILPMHVPTLAILLSGIVTVIESDGSLKQIFVSSGTVTINQDASVQVLAEEAHPIEDLDTSRCREIMLNAQNQLSVAVGQQEVAKAEIVLEVAEALVRAAE
ncbi:ATP synthase subunit delta, mitochondrial-like [Anopheles aquasalis]|uniref:ATP synthase subunit delta, mitochondrial-like n=1 Tax=Anopheles aquasalis TaxID=42839 RepID=UPI00215A2FDE|nr:ATP synthase subunit delta, mitochondrial-like [Anopheles aquasalis]